MTSARIANPISAAKKALPISLVLHALILAGLYYADWLDRQEQSYHSKAPEYVEVSMPEKPVAVESAPWNNLPVTTPEPAPAAPKARAQKPAVSGLARLLKQSHIHSGAMHARANAPDLSQVKNELKHLSSKGLPIVDSSSIQGIRGALVKAQKEEARSKFNWGAIENVSQSGSDTGADISAIVSALSKYQNEFRECYERALFVDAALAGKAQFLIGISESGSVSSSKVNLHLTHAESQAAQSLQGCLEAVGRKVHFPNTVGQQSVQFGLLLRS